MANVNYQSNPDPRGNWEPQGFLAGFNYQDRLNDYNKQRDLTNMNSQLSNEGLAARNTDYLHGQGARDMGYTQQEGAARNAVALQPDQLRLSTMQLQGDIQAQPGNNELKVWQSLQALPEAKKDLALRDTLKTATVLRGLPEGSDPSLAMGILDKIGVDTSRWKGMDSARVSKEFQFLGGLDAEKFKHFSKMEEVNATNAAQERIHGRTNDTSIAVARIVSEGRQKALTNTRAAFNNSLDEDVIDILSKPRDKWDSHDYAVVQTWQTLRNEPNAKAGAAALGAHDKIKKMLEALQEDGSPEAPNALPPPQPTPKGPVSKVTIPGTGEVDVLGKEGNRIRIRDPKTGKTGWYTP